MCFGEECQKIRSCDLCACGTMGYQALRDLRDAFLSLSLMRQCPATQDRTYRHPERKSLFRGEKNGGFRPLLGSTPLAAVLMELRRTAQGKTPAKRVRDLLSQRHRLLAPRQPLLRIAQGPQRPGGKDVANHARVLTIAECGGAVLLGIIERYPLRKMRV